jgi:Zn-dependent M28 family amino/carboxypeptidase
MLNRQAFQQHANRRWDCSFHNAAIPITMSGSDDVYEEEERIDAREIWSQIAAAALAKLDLDSSLPHIPPVLSPLFNAHGGGS